MGMKQATLRRGKNVDLGFIAVQVQHLLSPSRGAQVVKDFLGEASQGTLHTDGPCLILGSPLLLGSCVGLT